MKNVATYSSEGALIQDCQKVNFFYGPNGSGKSTISNFLSNPAASQYNISSIKAYKRNNPIKTSYELLWQELKEGSNTSLITTQNIMRRILENYFSMLGKAKDDTIVDSFATIEEKMICRSLLSWINDGSHSIPDDLYIDSYTDSIDRYKEIFKEVFIKMGHEAHYKMMMGES